jgi:hypothetical protein
MHPPTSHLERAMTILPRHPLQPPVGALLLASLLFLLLPSGAAAQAGHGDPAAQGHGHGHGSASDHGYADLLDREIRALAPEEIAALLAGEGMGFALAAELNGVPGPLHVLELREELELAPEQEARITRIFQEMRARTAELGSRVVELERTLDLRFRHRHVDAGTVAELTGAIAALRGEIRAIHLVAHLETDPVLSDAQRTRYQELRGYGASGPSGAAAGDHGGHAPGGLGAGDGG